MAARFAGAGGGRSLLFNGHIDVVPSDPRERWTSDPNRAEVRDGKLYGRGACDMKGGVAAMVFATEILSRLGVRLQGDLIVNTVTDEESSGAGGLAAVRHGVPPTPASSPSPPLSTCGSAAAARSRPPSSSPAGPATPRWPSPTGATAAR